MARGSLFMWAFSTERDFPRDATGDHLPGLEGDRPTLLECDYGRWRGPSLRVLACTCSRDSDHPATLATPPRRGRRRLFYPGIQLTPYCTTPVLPLLDSLYLS